MATSWKVTYNTKIPKLNKPVLIEGLPGIGNVGKVAADFIVDELKAKKLCELFSYTFPHSVFINEKNMIELPNISIYYKQFKDKRNDLLLLVGDVQPVDEVSSYEFAEEILNLCKKMNVSEIVTLGGIGLQNLPKKPNVYCTGNNKKLIDKFKQNTKIKTELYGVVGPIIGASGVLLGLSAKDKIPAVSLLAETYAHPMYLGINGAKEIIRILDNKLKLKLKVKKLEKEIKELEKEILKRSEDINKVTNNGRQDISYIG